MSKAAGLTAAVMMLGHAALATADPVDFARDIRPLLQQRCIECHGPEQQKGGYRLDRRSSALSGVTRRNILPGSSAGSGVYHRVSAPPGSGPQMPPKEPLAPGDIDTLKRWIDEGAAWPDALAERSRFATAKRCRGAPDRADPAG